MSPAHAPVETAGEDLFSALALVEEFSHRVLNDYARAVSTLRVAANQLGDPLARTTMMNTAQTLQNRAETFRVLQAQWGDEQEELGDYLECLCQTISTASLASAGIRLTFVRQTVQLPAQQCWCIGLAIAELITNSARHGLKWGGGEIFVEMSVGESDVRCTVRDSGNTNATLFEGRGRRIISTLVARFGGRADWIAGREGVSAIVQLPRPHRPSERRPH
jgi:two-component sensor histidine kinase